ncbi:[Pyruvate dehydrogenase [acetyl-transferring]]-phosphatase 2, mitochondrial [Schistosoma japonicum]|nr:[Pyruvate dehydrogenase [acetyl-transferring]]-phosphatase 2, mitochondrial [Schistosoma japonicum]
MKNVVITLNLILKKPFHHAAYGAFLRVACKRRIHGFIDGLENTIETKVSEADVSKRISGQELTYKGKNERVIFSANQVSVNRPVEDRWMASHFGDGNLNSPTLNDDKQSNNKESVFGGTLFTVVDGHGGHACAHAVNLLHNDYIISGLLPPKVSELALQNLRQIQELHTPRSICELAVTMWMTSGAVVTGESERIEFDLKGDRNSRFSNSNLNSLGNQRSVSWGPWGPWGPLSSSVRDAHVGHISRFLEELLSTCDERDFDQSVDDLRNYVADTAWALRNGLRRMDLDMSLAASPTFHGPVLDKALLRIVFAGCVATSIYIPCHRKELFAAQVGDCGAVIGSYSPLSGVDIKTSSSSDVFTQTSGHYTKEHWEAKLLIPPHTAENEADVQRVKSSHPLHEAEFVIRDGRLLGELMPLRAFGDIRFKWSTDDLKNIARLLDLPPNYPISPRFYDSPPYLVATPQVLWKPLTTLCDHFLILGTDGLWDVISPTDAVHVVAQHWYDYKGDPSYCGPGDTAASRLIRTALGGTEMNSEKIALHFSIPASVARYYRDDITVIVVYLPTAFCDSM